jgi:hypothetical protein
MCYVTDPQICYRPCGPDATGDRTTTCGPAGAYVEMPECNYNPAYDYSCWKIPTVAVAACGNGVTPREGADCDINACITCNSLGGLAGGVYIGAAGATTIGFCECVGDNLSGINRWSCATDTDWPCPRSRGC